MTTMIEDPAAYCETTRDALAAALHIDPALIDHNLDCLQAPRGGPERLIWHEILAPDAPVSALRWDDATGWAYTTGPFNAADMVASRWRSLETRPDCDLPTFTAAVAAACGQAVVCGHCRHRLQLFGGVWFRVHIGGATCDQSPNTEHAPSLRPPPSSSALTTRS